MEVSYKKNLGRSYMCIEEQGQPLEPYELQILENCSIPGFLQLQTNIYEGKRRYLYDISGKQQLEDYLAGKKIGNEMLQRFLFSIYRICTDLPEYLLREEGLCLEMRFIYVNLEDGSLQFTYLPFYDKNLPEAFEVCVEQLLRKLNHQDKAAVELGYRVYQLCAGNNANIGQVLETALAAKIHSEKEESLAELENGVWQKAKETEESMGIEESGQKGKRDGIESMRNAAQSLKMENGKALPKEAVREFLPIFRRVFAHILEKAGINWHKMEKRKPACLQKVKRSNRGPDVSESLPERRNEVNFVDLLERGNEVSSVDLPERRNEVSFADLPESRKEAGMGQMEDSFVHATEILAAGFSKPMGKLVYRGVHACEDIQVEGEEFLVGKNSEQVSGVILAEGISRLHAKVTFRDGKYFIEDLNSTNGTFLNDMPLEYHQPCELKINDRIRFGIEEYTFE